MKIERFYKAVILVLLLINIGTLAFMWFHRPGRGKMIVMEGPAGRPFAPMMLKRELGFSDDQMKQYQSLRLEHREAMKAITMRDREIHKRFFNLALTKPADAPEVKATVDSIAAIRKEMEMITYSHFAKMVGLLTPEQKKNFGPVYERLLHSILLPGTQMRGPGMMRGMRGMEPQRGLPEDPENDDERRP
jgi:hypothetical protein